MNCLVSIIVPVYNVEKYLEKCLESLISQTWKNLQIIVVNDGSTDSSAEIISEYIKKDRRIEAYEKENGGLSDARNFGLQYVKGQYVEFVDSDDYLEVTAIEQLVTTAVNTNADIIESAYYQDFGNYKKLKTISHHMENGYLAFGCTSACNKLYSVSLLINSKVSFLKGIIYEDVNFNAKLTPFVKNKAFVDIPLYNYVQRAGSICHNYDMKIKEMHNSLGNIKTFYESNGFFETYKEGLEYLFIKELYGSSFVRARHIKDKQLRKKVLKDNREFLEQNFPHYTRNLYLRNLSKLNLLLNLLKFRFIYSLFIR